MSVWTPPLFPGKPTVTFFGQAGFYFVLKNGVSVAVDLYLSDCCDRYFGFKRLLPYLVSPSDLHPDWLIATHAHYDHFDPDSVPILMADGRTRLLCAKDVRQETERLNLDASRITFLSAGDRWEGPGFSLRAMPCDHGPDTPDAIGILLSFDGKKVYLAGDTCFRPDIFSDPELSGADLAILPINGAYGNLNETEAADAAAILKPKRTVPCHFWNFAQHGGSPALFCEAMRNRNADLPVLLMRPGETVPL